MKNKSRANEYRARRVLKKTTTKFNFREISASVCMCVCLFVGLLIIFHINVGLLLIISDYLNVKCVLKITHFVY